jgi:phosphatidylglycerol---prolipoprotein diacylglyceryl transferase
VGRAADVCAPAVMVGLAAARVGCLWRGCDFGEPTGGGWGVRYPWGTAALRWLYEVGDVGVLSRVGVPMHPFPLYEAAPTLLMGLCAMGVRPGRGRLALWCAWGYASARGVAELFRGDAPLVALPWGVEVRALVLVCGVLSAGAAWLLAMSLSHPRPDRI